MIYYVYSVLQDVLVLYPMFFINKELVVYVGLFFPPLSLQVLGSFLHPMGRKPYNIAFEPLRGKMLFISFFPWGVVPPRENVLLYSFLWNVEWSGPATGLAELPCR